MPTRAALFIAMAASLPAAADRVEVYASQNAGRPEQFVPPDYPKEALARGVTGYVDVDASVDGMLTLHDVHFKAGAPDAQAFVPGLQEVAKYWLFHPANDGGNCFPSSSQRIAFRVIYEIQAGAPHISLELPTPAGKTTKALQAQCPRMRYPGGALRNGMSANVFARVDIRPDGTVSDVKTEAYPGDRADRFAEEVDSSLRHCRFAPAESPDLGRAACYGIYFRVH